MERLTERERNIDGTGVAKEEITDGLLKPFAGKILTKLATYEDLEEQGLLVRLPFKLGTVLFRINKGARKPIIKMKVLQITVASKSYSVKAIEEDYGEVFFSGDAIGLKVFLTREEAEKKLEEVKNGL